MRSDQEIINSAFSKACNELGIKVKYNTQPQKLVFIKAMVELSSLFGGDNKQMKHWMNTYNRHLMFIPAKMLEDEDKLYTIANYLEGFNNK